MPTLIQKIESLLFYRAEPIAKKELAKLCSVSLEECTDALATFAQDCTSRGIALLDDGDSVALRTSPDTAAFLDQIIQEERATPLSKATSEVLSVILYMDKPTRAEIDFIRGVNSTFSLRALLIRGLVDRVAHESDARKLVYVPTIELLSHLGVARVEDLPQFAETRASLTAELAQATKEENLPR
jgi:segregation and condensation protein B